MKQNLRQYHARKTEGILSLCPCCYHVPLRIMSGNHPFYREYGVRNGATCVFEAWELDPIDKVALESSHEPQVVLRALPKQLIVRMDRPLAKQCEGLPSSCVPLSPLTVYWILDTENQLNFIAAAFHLF